VRVLVTGGRGRIGAAVVAALQAGGDETVVFDAADGWDVRDIVALRRAAAGCEAIVHLGAIPGDTGAPEEIMSVNVIGTWQVLRVALELRHPRLVMTSSAQAVGVYMGHRLPDYLPLDDAHPSYPGTPYAQSKYLDEQLCAAVTRTHGMATVCLRPPLVMTDALLAELGAADPDDAVDWNHGSWIHVDDVASAVVSALRCPGPGHAVLLLSAADTRSDVPTAELLRRVYPSVPWRGAPLESLDPHVSLVDASAAGRMLGWSPRRRFHAAVAAGRERP
jgi:UDP-glucose 4-epimerase